jgi:hypothetical protein
MRYAKVLLMTKPTSNRSGEWRTSYFSGKTKLEALLKAYAYGSNLTEADSALPEIAHVRSMPRSAVPVAKLHVLDRHL